MPDYPTSIKLYTLPIDLPKVKQGTEKLQKRKVLHKDMMHTLMHQGIHCLLARSRNELAKLMLRDTAKATHKFKTTRRELRLCDASHVLNRHCNVEVSPL